MKCNHNDCFTCPYPDCVIGNNQRYVRQNIGIASNTKEYKKKYDELNKERISEKHKEWYNAHKEEISAKRKAITMSKHKTCVYCGKRWHSEAFMYKKKVFCNSECLCDWLSEQGLIKILREKVKA